MGVVHCVLLLFTALQVSLIFMQGCANTSQQVQTLSFEHHNEMQRLSVEIKSEQLKLTNETTKYEHVLREVQEREEKMKIQVDELTRELQVCVHVDRYFYSHLS